MDEDQFFSDKPQSNILVQLLHRYLPFWPLLAILLSISLSVAFIYLRSQTKIYVATAKVLLKDPQKGGGDSKVLDALNIFSEKKIVENEILVLRSATIMQEVVKQLNLYTTVYNEGKVQTEELYGNNSPLHFEAIHKDSINEGGKFALTVNWKTKFITIDNRKYGFDDLINIAGTKYRIIVNNNYNKNAVGKNYFVVFNSSASAAGGIISGLTAAAISFNSTVINLEIKTPVPEKGIKILNKLIEVYNIASINDKNEIAQRTFKFVNDRLNKVTAELDSVERMESSLRAREGITDLSAQGTQYEAIIRELDQKKTAIDLQTDMLAGIQSYVYSKGKRPGTVPSQGLVSDPTLSSLLSQLYGAEFELDGAKAVAGEKSETVMLAEEKVTRLKNDIKENINNIRSGYQIQRKSINENIAVNNGLLATLPGKERALLAISRQQEIKNNIYTFLLNKREETAISSAATTADMRVLESGSSYGPISPVPKNYYLVGLLCGLLAFLVFIQLTEPLSNKVLFRTEIETKTKVPVVGEIILAIEKNNIAITEGKRTVIAEQFRSLRTNLSFMGVSAANKTILVTSFIAGEGKSFVATNLALSITLTGKKVALIELDLRKPKLSRELGVKRDPGISNYLINKTSLDEIIKPTAHNNLFLVTAGPIPPNPTELIDKKEFGEMLAEIKERFDYIIIDSAPIGPVTDSQLLNKYAETTIFVVRHNTTPSVFLKMIDGLKRENKFSNMCVVFNGVKPRGTSFLNYGFGGYGNGYAYGYGYGNEASSYYTEDVGQPGFKNLFGFVGFMKKLFKKRR